MHIVLWSAELDVERKSYHIYSYHSMLEPQYVPLYIVNNRLGHLISDSMSWFGLEQLLVILEIRWRRKGHRFYY